MTDDTSKNTIEESAAYDNCVGKIEVLQKPAEAVDSLFEGWESTADQEAEWKKYWKGMPEFVQETNAPYMKIYVSFRNEEDYKAFAELVDQNLSNKTKSIWYPKLDRDANFMKRWIEEE